MNDKSDCVILQFPELKKKKRPPGIRAVCPECGSFEEWKLYLDKKNNRIVAITCTSNECDGFVLLNVQDMGPAC